ncbi:MAG: hypothetical protein A2504_17300 [Bdellovibrionales bacterium RIFOXYD12_FULL_39_22]|nr:MAG: hypothetical protein A2385_10660 [Bdellovibrionales bacterium RIFOXYB1_FULL_39_21]OFZ40762.1 MAG: hypothetical protein A2485_17070 [Bdellovibrionales bacterium RIFOXYC12_FULL_39_17]OFZ48184.1 MAG: hypothetical protein A2404_17230 [Bdellovibrionales bacterium RIFOXYC1_FULL_39_130]OFZ75024.1 MAG: hypothetical protein A2451_05690 [Bdellovibrionales bacterium RIFOXYC2_FULL_39_8]OFZ75834.1 MAG: hypothetical protein A2560_13730 [Bdellovibrionales bacterium RIFOXYD1_FULL_39_84]OFZ91895.1 MAG:
MKSIKLILFFLLVIFVGCKSEFKDGLTDDTNKSKIEDDGTESDGPSGSELEGLSAKYPHDAGIENDPDVILAENFDNGSLDTLLEKWTIVKNKAGMSLVADGPANSANSKSIQMTRLGGDNTGGDVRKRLDQIGQENHNELYLRYYIKMAAPVLGQKRDSSNNLYTSYLSGSHHHTGGGLSGENHNCPWGTGRAGIRPTGGSFTPACPSDPNAPIYDNRFSVRLELRTDDNLDKYDFRNDILEFYNYWMGMHHNASTPEYYGNSFVGDYNLKFQREEWVCIEIMVKLNNPVSEKNGELKLWVDGKFIMHRKEGFPDGKWLHSAFLPFGSSAYDWNQANWPYSMNQVQVLPFEGFQWRDSEVLKLNMVSLAYYVTKDTIGNAWVRYDNVVVSKRYIGPIAP